MASISKVEVISAASIRERIYNRVRTVLIANTLMNGTMSVISSFLVCDPNSTFVCEYDNQIMMYHE